MRVVVITGSRHWRHVAPIRRALRRAELLIVGDAPGADTIAFHEAVRSDVIVAMYCASPANAARADSCLAQAGAAAAVFVVSDWAVQPYQAGPIRNLAMVARAVQERAAGMDVRCYAAPLPDSIGTIHCMHQLSKAGFPVRVLHAA